MSSLRDLYVHVQTYGMKHRHLYLISLMMFFWKMFDGIISYITPLVVVDSGISKTTMGLIYSSSSVFGVIFDIVLSKYLKNSNYRKIFLLLMIVSCVHPLILWQAKTIWMFVIAMATWGLYYDLANFGILDFISRKVSPEEHTSSFGVTDVFRALGNLLAPILAGVLIVEIIDWKLYALSWFFVILAALVLLIAVLFAKRSHYEYLRLHKERTTSFFEEVFALLSTIRFIYPMLILTIIIFIYDAFFWTLGPIFSEQFAVIHPLNGLFLAAYSFPTLVVGWFVGGIAKKYGNYKTAYYSFLAGSALLLVFWFLNTSPVILFLLVLFSSALTSISLSASKGVFSKAIIDHPHKENEIQGLSDISLNIGYVIGPVSAGFLADRIGNLQSFTVLGVIGILASLYLLRLKVK